MADRKMAQTAIERRGANLYAHVYAALPGQCADIARRIGVRLDTAQRVIREFKALGLCHRSATIETGPRNMPTSHYERGPGVNVPYPRGHLRNTTPKPGTIAFASVIRHLQVGDTLRSTHDATGCSVNYLRTLLATLRRLGACHISGWDHVGVHPVPELCAAPGQDAPRPKPKTKRQIDADWRSRQQARRSFGVLGQALRAAA